MGEYSFKYTEANTEKKKMSIQKMESYQSRDAQDVISSRMYGIFEIYSRNFRVSECEMLRWALDPESKNEKTYLWSQRKIQLNSHPTTQHEVETAIKFQLNQLLNFYGIKEFKTYYKSQYGVYRSRRKTIKAVPQGAA